jgi:uncharacterized protein YuzE
MSMSIEVSISCTYDADADAAYIRIMPKGTRIENTYLCDPIEVDGQIHIDLSDEGQIVGIEILGASAKMPCLFDATPPTQGLESTN